MFLSVPFENWRFGVCLSENGIPTPVKETLLHLLRRYFHFYYVLATKNVDFFTSLKFCCVTMLPCVLDLKLQRFAYKPTTVTSLLRFQMKSSDEICAEYGLRNIECDYTDADFRNLKTLQDFSALTAVQFRFVRYISLFAYSVF